MEQKVAVPRRRLPTVRGIIDGVSTLLGGVCNHALILVAAFPFVVAFVGLVEGELQTITVNS